MRKVLLLIVLMVLAGCTDESKNAEITVSAAASLKDALEEIQLEFQQEHSDISVNFNFGSTGALQQQITKGAPTDIFLSASKDHFNQLVDGEFIEEDYTVDLLKNSLVLIGTRTHNESITLENLKENRFGRISIGTPETVPAGKYAKEALETEKVWQSIENKIVPASDVRQVLSYVESKNVDAGIVYKTDAITSEKVKVLYEIPESLHTPLIYSVGVVSQTKNIKEAEEFYQFIKSEKSVLIFKKYGFKGLNE